MALFKIGFIPVSFIDLIDISVVAVGTWYIQRTLRNSVLLRGVWLIIGVFVAWRLVELANMVLLKSILQEVLKLSALVVIVLLGPELRRLIFIKSRLVFFENLRRQINIELDDRPVVNSEEIIEASLKLSDNRTGALIVLLRTNSLEQIISTGDRLDASVSTRLLISIFNPKSPLHDGAVLVQGNQIIAARCVLPVSDDPDLPPELGLRHRSALGLSEVSDAVALVVSEETGQISIAYQGRLKRNLSAEELQQYLGTLFQSAR
jgi:uncharacterized protein (TIGR00159 family)